MTVISNTNYYSLTNSTTSSNADSAASAQQLPSLAAILESVDSSDTSSSQSNSDGFLLDLSPSAQAYLQQQQTGSSSSSSATGSTTFTLTPTQQQKLASILEKYKDEPFTQETFDQIQDDMTAAGIGINQLSAQDAAQQFNPTSQLLDTLNGISPTSTSTVSTKTKASNFIQQVIDEWKSISTTADSTTESSGTSA
jgi:hypothetical protein